MNTKKEEVAGSGDFFGVWKPWRYGWGETLRLARGIELQASRGTLKEDMFYFEALGARSKATIPTIEEAKNRAEAYARKKLTEALARLTEQSNAPT